MFQYYFELKLDGVRKWRLENGNPRSFSNVKIWAAQCRHGFPPANAYIDNLQYDIIGKTHIHTEYTVNQAKMNTLIDVAS